MEKVRTAILTAISFVLIAVASACYQNTEYGEQPAQTKAAYLDEVTVRVHYIADVDDIHKSPVCSKLPKERTYVGCAVLAYEYGRMVCDMYLQMPKDFNDKARLLTQGHELHHCLGALHVIAN